MATASARTRSLLYSEDFIEMLKRGDSVEDVARYAQVSVASLERRFFRLPKEVRDEIRSCRSGRGFDWWRRKVRGSSTLARKNREKCRIYYQRRK